MQINLEGLSETELGYFEQIETLFNQLAFLNPKFKILHLCAVLDYDINKTAKLIKKIYGVSFRHLVNYNRISHFEKIISQKVENQEKLDIATIIKESGFATRSLFYAYFKELKGKSPSDYFLP